LATTGSVTVPPTSARLPGVTSTPWNCHASGGQNLLGVVLKQHHGAALLGEIVLKLCL
jgi:hypothetical protein